MIHQTKRWAWQFFGCQVLGYLLAAMGCLLVLSTAQWLSYLFGGGCYLFCQSILITFAFYHVGGRSVKKQAQFLYLGEAIKLIGLGISVYAVHQVYPLQMLFFLLGWAIPHTAYVWAPFIIERAHDHD